jgi:hypothetical protein
MELLDKIEAFQYSTIDHPHLKAARHNMVLAIRRAVQGSLIFMFGPTGVGKSTLLSNLKTQLAIEYQKEIAENPSIQPVALFEAAAPDIQRFSWKDFYLRALVQLNEPLVDKKLISPPRGFSRPARSDPGAPGHELRAALENALFYRKTRVMMIDEAQHIARGVSAGGLYNQLDYLKSLANLTKTVIVMVGTYDLLAFRNLSGQLSRRSIDVHFPRYLAAKVTDLEDFVNVIGTFENRIPYQCNFTLTERTEELYAGSLGCVGVLSGWIFKAMHSAYAAGDKHLSWKHFEETILTYDQMDKMTNELLTGENLLKSPKNGLERIGTRLGLPGNSTSPAEGGKRKLRVGTRKPIRDAVAGNADG